VASSFPHGTVHEAGEDLQAALQSDPKVFGLWESLTPLGRNEFICWVDDAKQPTTRQRRIERTCDELLEGKKRPNGVPDQSLTHCLAYIIWRIQIVEKIACDEAFEEIGIALPTLDDRTCCVRRRVRKKRIRVSTPRLDHVNGLLIRPIASPPQQLS
jgi:hypothetical protein